MSNLPTPAAVSKSRRVCRCHFCRHYFLAILSEWSEAIKLFSPFEDFFPAVNAAIIYPVRVRPLHLSYPFPFIDLLRWSSTNVRSGENLDFIS